MTPFFNARRPGKVSPPVVLLVLAGTAAVAGGAWAVTHLSPHQALAPGRAAAGEAAHAGPAGATDYTCSMHPNVHQDHPGDCPICGMKLIVNPHGAAAAGAGQRSGAASSRVGTAPAPVPSAAASLPPLPPGLQEVRLSHDQELLANVATAVVARRAIAQATVAAGQIVYDETRLAQVTARVDGRIERLYVNSTGARIVKGQPMATLYSPDLVASLQDYLTAQATEREMRHGGFADLAAGTRATVVAARQRLERWGLTDAQIARAARGGRPAIALPLLAPTSGVVIKKMVVAGQYVKTGDALFDVADLSRVWVEANVFEAQLSAIQPGQAVTVTTAAYPGQTFFGRVAFVYPFLSPETRTIKVRASLPNPGGRLKPQMFVNVRIEQGRPGALPLAIPASAVVDAGRRKIVFVEIASGVFRPREVSLGAVSGDYDAVIAGLKAGDRVATSGGFLLDANSQIQTGGEDTGSVGMPAAPASGRAAPGAAAPNPGTSAKSRGPMPGMAMPPAGAAGHP